jgi:hypothetical protein
VSGGRLLQSVAAQDASPTAAPAACDIEPRPVDFLIAIVQAPDPETTPTPIDAVPTGTPVDDATRAAVTGIINTLTICVNQGDYLRAFALFDDAYLRRIIDPEGLMSEDVAFELGKSLATPSSSAEIPAGVTVQILSVNALADGSVAVAFQTIDPSSDDEPAIDLYVLDNRDGKWVIIDGATAVGD